MGFADDDTSEDKAAKILEASCVEVAKGDFRLNERMMTPYLKVLDNKFETGGECFVLHTGLDMNKKKIEERIYKRMFTWLRTHDMLREERESVKNNKKGGTRGKGKVDRWGEYVSRVNASIGSMPFSEIKEYVDKAGIFGGRLREIEPGVFDTATRIKWRLKPHGTKDEQEENKERGRKTLGINYVYKENGHVLGEIVYQAYESMLREDRRMFTVNQWVDNMIPPEKVGKNMSFEEIGYAMIGTLYSLRELWSMGIIHRDIKPDNIMMNRRDGKVTAVLGDLGLVKEMRAQDSLSVTKPGTLLGTPQYMSPEQINNEKDPATKKSNVDYRTDLYSLGAMFYELFSKGEEVVPAGKDRDGNILRGNAMVFDVFKRISSGEIHPKPLRDLKEAMGTRKQKRYMDEVLAGLLMYDRKDRYQSVEILADDIKSVCGGRKPRNIRWHGKHNVGKHMDSYLYEVFKIGESNHPYLYTTAVTLGAVTAVGVGALAAAYFTNDGFRKAADAFLMGLGIDF
ncbi:MAG: protein kinase [Candidatus Aenigmarchaeota archaeon]